MANKKEDESNIIGQVITEVRPMTKDELDAEGWEDRQGTATVIVLKNGVKLYPSQDPEGNGPGAIFGADKKRNFVLA